MIEFEVKARVPLGEEARVRKALGAPVRVERQVDAYLAHPSRDFASTDEALRVRVAGGRTEVTYKGPKLDRDTKARREITLTAAEGEAAALALFSSLSFRLVARVAKTRSLTEFRGFEAAFDEIEGLGAFVELERALPDGASLEDAKRDARDALSALALHETERRSYLELLLARGAGP